jgi:hypothetical protein
MNTKTRISITPAARTQVINFMEHFMNTHKGAHGIPNTNLSRVQNISRRLRSVYKYAGKYKLPKELANEIHSFLVENEQQTLAQSLSVNDKSNSMKKVPEYEFITTSGTRKLKVPTVSRFKEKLMQGLQDLHDEGHDVNALMNQLYECHPRWGFVYIPVSLVDQIKEAFAQEEYTRVISIPTESETSGSKPATPSASSNQGITHDVEPETKLEDMSNTDDQMEHLDELTKTAMLALRETKANYDTLKNRHEELTERYNRSLTSLSNLLQENAQLLEENTELKKTSSHFPQSLQLIRQRVLAGMLLIGKYQIQDVAGFIDDVLSGKVHVEYNADEEQSQ